MKLARTQTGGWTGRRLVGQKTRSVVDLLSQIGVDAHVQRGTPCNRADCPRRGSKQLPLWKRPDGEIVDVLKFARTNYLKLVKRHHPDAGGKASDMAKINFIWSRIVRIFSKHGYQLDLPAKPHHD